MEKITLGVIADTHIPDRSRELNPAALEVFARAGVQAILHAGDICVPQVLAALQAVAPVHAVRGNRDWVRMRHLPAVLRLHFLGSYLVLVHGHGGLRGYFSEKLTHLFTGYQLTRYQRYLLSSFPEADIIVFGHSHRPLNLQIGRTLLFNPGSACCPELPEDAPTVGLLHIQDGSIQGQLVLLPAAPV